MTEHEFIWEKDDDITFYGSSNIYMSGKNGSIRGRGTFGQYQLMAQVHLI